MIRALSVPPRLIAEILDGGQLTAVAGLTLSPSSLAADAAFGGGTANPPAPTYQPVSFESSAAPAMHNLAPSSLTVLHDVELVVTAESDAHDAGPRPARSDPGDGGRDRPRRRRHPSPCSSTVDVRRGRGGGVIDEEFGIRITEIAPTGEHTR